MTYRRNCPRPPFDRASPDHPAYRLTKKLVTLGVTIGLTICATIAHVATVDAQDTATVLTEGEIALDFAVGGGSLYWVRGCDPPSAPTSPAVIRRTSTGGGAIRVIKTESEATCVSPGFHALAADADGTLYYDRRFNLDFAGVKLPVSSPESLKTVLVSSSPLTGPIFDFTIGPFTGPAGEIVGGLALDETAAYRRIREGGLVFGTLKDGSRGCNLTDGAFGGDTALVTAGTSVFWIDQDGLSAVLKDVTTCTNGVARHKSTILSAAAGGTHLVMPSNRGAYWITADETRIEHLPCFLTGPGSSCQAGYAYIADPGWEIHALAASDNALFWTEVATAEFNNRLIRMRLDTGDVEDLTAEGDLSLVGSRVLAVDATAVYYNCRLPSPGICKLPLNATGVKRDYEVLGIEVTQAIQSLNNDVPLVASKPTFVRVYGHLKEGRSASGVPAEVRGFLGGKELPGSPLHPLNGGRQLVEDDQTPGQLSRRSANDAWLFQLPDLWTREGEIALTAEVAPRKASDRDPRNNVVSVGPLPFYNKAPVCTVFVPVRTPGGRASTGLPGFWNMIGTSTRYFPAPDIWVFEQSEDIAKQEICFALFIPYPCFDNYALPENKARVLTSLWERDLFTDDPDQCDDAGAKTHYVGMVNPAYSPGFNGSGATPGATLILWLRANGTDPNAIAPGAGVTLAHELGHNYGREHVNCGCRDATCPRGLSNCRGCPEDLDDDYPYNPAYMDDAPLGTGAEHVGFDVSALQPIAPNLYGDLMSYCDPRWPSDYT